MKTEKNEMEYKNTIEEWRVIYRTMDKRMGQRCVWGPFTEEQIPQQYQQYHANPVFVKDESRMCVQTAKLIPKARTIIDCSNSQTPGRAPNDFITEEEKSVKYPSIIQIVSIIVKVGIIWMIAADAENAFNRVPIANEYIRHYAIRLANLIIFWTALVFGGASSCAVYTTFALMLGWIMINECPDIFIIKKTRVLVSYLDDFWAGHSTLEGAWRQYNMIRYGFDKYGVPTQEKKMNIPTTRLKFIGFIIDTMKQQLEIPADKMVKLRLKAQRILRKWRKGETITMTTLAAFIGLTRYTTYVIYYIIPYLRRLEEAVANKNPKQRIKGNKEMEMDITKILKAIQIPERNKISFHWLLYPKDKGDIEIETDASTGYGMGGIEMMDKGTYYGIAYEQIENWPKKNPPDIVYLELMAVLVALKINPRRYRKKAILLRVDNEAVCAIIRKKSACFERKDLQQLIREICEIAIKEEFYFWIKWISTEENVRADRLSRGKKNPITTCHKQGMIRRDEKAIKIATRVIEMYKNTRKRMQRHRQMEKRCNCENETLCKDQPLYKKWMN